MGGTPVAMDALDLSARLLAILTNAREHNYQLAIYKAIKTVQALGAEFGQDTKIYEPTEPYHYPKQALKALKNLCKECEAALAVPFGASGQKIRGKKNSKNVSTPHSLLRRHYECDSPRSEAPEKNG